MIAEHETKRKAFHKHLQPKELAPDTAPDREWIEERPEIYPGLLLN